jgi:hypothetical protein
MKSGLSVVLGQAIDLLIPVAEDDAPWTTPRLGSRAAAELADEEALHPEPETGSWPWLLAPLIARLALQVGAEEAKALRLLLDTDSTSYGADVLCRSVLETLSLAWWLLDPAIDSPKRRARAMLYRLHSARQTEMAIRHLGLQAEEDRVGYGEVPERVERDAANLGIAFDRKGRSIGCQGEVWPNYSERVALLVSSVWPQPSLPYAILSAVAHGELLGLTRNVGSNPGEAALLRPARGANWTWLWHDTYLASGALVFSAERAANFLGLTEPMRAVEAGKLAIQQALEALRSGP